MAETYCGKSCAECAKKDELNCTGCKTGPGRQFGGDCELARCVRNKGHETCGTCAFKGNCGTLRSCDHMPDYRRQKIEAEKMRKAAVEKRAPVLGKWLWFIFWLFIPNGIGGLMSNDTIVKLLPGLYIPGELISAFCALAYGAILWKLSTEEERYRTAGICTLIAGAFSFLTAFVKSSSESTGSLLILLIPDLIASLIGQYNEYMAHSAVLTGVDNQLSEKWEVLWKWNIGFVLGMFGCTIVFMIIPILGAIAVLGCAIGSIVVGVLRLVYLYRTAKTFREYAHAALSET